jgi:hypothetical protein
MPAVAASFLSPRDVSEMSARKAKSGDMNGGGEGGREARKEQSKEGIALPSWARGGAGGADNERHKGSAWARNEVSECDYPDLHIIIIWHISCASSELYEYLYVAILMGQVRVDESVGLSRVYSSRL